MSVRAAADGRAQWAIIPPPGVLLGTDTVVLRLKQWERLSLPGEYNATAYPRR